MVALLRYLFTEVLGHSAWLADGVQRALGREPRDFADYARDAAAAGAWSRRPGRPSAMDGALFVLALITALGCGLASGVFFAFSSFVMPALGRLPAAEGIAAMQSINVLAVTPAFMTALFGTAAACMALAVWVLASPDGNSPALVIAGTVAYLAGVVGVTGARNVPLNDRLAAIDAGDPRSVDLWHEYLRRWTAWNHVRTVTPLAAAAALTVALTL